MKKIKNEIQKIGILRANARIMNHADFAWFKDWIDMESQNDPHYFRWLFDNNSISDFGGNLTVEDWEEYGRFLDMVQDYIEKHSN